MPKRRMFKVNKEQRDELEDVREHHAKAYMRERAAALIKIADGASPHHVALNGLLKPREPDTVYNWLNRYEAEGIAGLSIRNGRGRRAAFFP